MRLSPHFTSEEFECKCGCGLCDVSEALLSYLEDMREELCRPMQIASGCRCHHHNQDVGGVSNSAHTRGTAADIVCRGGFERFQLVTAAVNAGVVGIGIAKSFVHVDVDEDIPRPAVWSY